jgi:3',5'-cyclic AMP phosphodiesterase CpdA
MSLIVQISDPHFGTEQPPAVQALTRLVQRQQPGLVLLSGDITQRARRSQFTAARAFVDSLAPAPVIAIPGNHDIPLFDLAARVMAPYANYREAFGDELEPEFETPGLLALMVNTTRHYRHKDGEVSPQQVERIAARLARAQPAQLRLVVTHQPVCVTRPQDKENLLHGHEEAIRRWSQAGADLILGGHIHLPYVCALHEAWPGLARRAWAVQAGTALSSRVRHGASNSVNLIRHAEDGDARNCVVERWDFTADLQDFAPVAISRLELDREHEPRS